MMDRRTFIKISSCSAAGYCLLRDGKVLAGDDGVAPARYYEKLPYRKIKCTLCPRECVIDDLERGYCGVRENRGGTYYTLVHGNPCSAHIDPIEKKPLFHFLPGTLAFSIATVGCNVFCKFCQNWQISQARPEQVKSMKMSPEKVAKVAVERNCPSVAYTYTEPVVFTEYMYDTARACRDRNIKSVMISNGYIQKEPMKDLCTVLNAVKIDLKAFTRRFYKELVAGELKPVLDTLILLRQQNMWTEIVYLIIPGQNDDPGELEKLSKWIVEELGPDTPLHFSRFYPQYRLKNLPATPISTLETARKIALDNGLKYVYIGNVPGHAAENTYCPSCQRLLVKRTGYRIIENAIQNNRCSYCSATIAGVW
ncbi:AmmeMemoRadiSam system radical SAM enzyme [candidate division KSB1 bacterium]|nr:AmmeMemoRadiSam system radical SAM enzyme [candidate division KSB1 bacterium]